IRDDLVTGVQTCALPIFVTKERADSLGVELVDMDRLLGESDYITFHVPLTEKTKGMIGAAQFKKMKRTVRLVNTSRGGVIDEKRSEERRVGKESTCGWTG